MIWFRLVEHYSPKCDYQSLSSRDQGLNQSLISGGHCRHFAPTWSKLARENQHLERLSGFYMAQVNCLAQGGEPMVLPTVDEQLKFPNRQIYVIETRSNTVSLLHG